MPELTTDPPAAAEAEQVLIGSLMELSASDRAALLRALKVDHFSTEANRITFGAILSLHRRGESADPMTVLSELQRQGLVSSWPTPAASVGNYLHDAVAAVAVPLGYAPALRAVLEASFRRRVHQSALRLCQASGSSSIDGLTDLVNRENAAVAEAMGEAVSA